MTWPTAAEMANKLRRSLEGAGNIAMSATLLDVLESRLTEWFDNGGVTTERKISRLNEKLKDAIERERYGPLFVDAIGARVAPADFDPALHQETQAYQIWRDMKEIYNQDVLDNVDEEGNLV